MMLTSSGQYGDAARCRELQIASYLTKPINAAELLDAISKVMQPATAAAAGTAFASAPPAAAVAPLPCRSTA